MAICLTDEKCSLDLSFSYLNVIFRCDFILHGTLCDFLVEKYETTHFDFKFAIFTKNTINLTKTNFSSGNWKKVAKFASLGRSNINV